MQLLRIDDDQRIAGEHGSWTVQRRNKHGVWIVVEEFKKFHHAFKYALERTPPKGESNDDRTN
jgi:hypothetical protein